jgi:hypothetical protein
MIPERRQLEALTGPRTDAYRCRTVCESAYHHLEEQRLRVRRHAQSDADFAAINREIQLALGHLEKARGLAERKRVALPLVMEPEPLQAAA